MTKSAECRIYRAPSRAASFGMLAVVKGDEGKSILEGICSIAPTPFHDDEAREEFYRYRPSIRSEA